MHKMGACKILGCKNKKTFVLVLWQWSQRYNPQDAWHGLMNLYWPETEALGGSLVRVSVHTRVFVTLNVMAGNLVLAKVMSGLRRFGETLPPPANRPRPGFDPGFRWGHQSTTSTLHHLHHPGQSIHTLHLPNRSKLWPTFPYTGSVCCAAWRNGRSIAGVSNAWKIVYRVHCW